MTHKYDPDLSHRHSLRLKEYDYSQAGAYFVTVCTYKRECLFGEVVGGTMKLNGYGQVVTECWEWLSVQYSHVNLDEWVVMPNHFHGILVIADTCRGGSRTAPTPTRHKPLGRLIGAFKTISTKRINQIRGTPGVPIWQRNYYEHVVRNEDDLLLTREYIVNNPIRWVDDENNPGRLT